MKHNASLEIKPGKLFFSPMHYKKIIQHIEKTAPLQIAEDWDNSGVQIASAQKEIEHLAIALDPSWQTIKKSVELKADFILCHHPLTLKPTLPSRLNTFHRILRTLLERDTWLYSAHTSLDANPEGPVTWLADLFKLKNLKTIYPCCSVSAIRIEFNPLLPFDQFQQFVEQFEILDYQQDSDLRVRNMLLWPDKRQDFVSFIYSKFADVNYSITQLNFPVKKYGLGVCGRLDQEMDTESFLKKLSQIIELATCRFIGNAPAKIKKIAYCPGSGADFAQGAFSSGADIYITGDVKYHQAQAIEEMGYALDVGHFILEEEMMRTWSVQLQEELPDLKISFIKGKDPFVAQITNRF